MKTVHRGIALGVLHCLLVLSVAGKYAWDRERLPQAWAKAAPFDPYLPIRGRYVSLSLEVAFASEVPGGEAGAFYLAALSAENGKLTARRTTDKTGNLLSGVPPHMTLAAPVAYFIPEHAADPTHLQPGEELWVEVSVPPSGPPRPIRLGVKRNGVLSEISVR